MTPTAEIEDNETREVSRERETEKLKKADMLFLLNRGVDQTNLMVEVGKFKSRIENDLIPGGKLPHSKEHFNKMIMAVGRNQKVENPDLAGITAEQKKLGFLETKTEKARDAEMDKNEKLVEPLLTILERVNQFDSAGFEKSEPDIDAVFESYVSLTAEMSISTLEALDLQEFLIKNEGESIAKTSEPELYHSQIEAVESITEERAEKIGKELRELIISKVGIDNFYGLVERSDALRGILANCVDKIILQEGSQNLINLSSELGQFSISKIKIATEDLLNAEIEKYDLLADFFEKYIEEKQNFVGRKAVSENQKKSTDREAIIEPIEIIKTDEDYDQKQQVLDGALGRTQAERKEVAGILSVGRREAQGIIKWLRG